MIHIIDYEAGNATSVKRAFDHIGVDSAITKDSDVVRNADRLVFPGVGRARAAMGVLKESGLDRALTDAYWHRLPKRRDTRCWPCGKTGSGMSPTTHVR